MKYIFTILMTILCAQSTIILPSDNSLKEYLFQPMIEIKPITLLGVTILGYIYQRIVQYAHEKEIDELRIKCTERIITNGLQCVKVIADHDKTLKETTKELKEAEQRCQLFNNLIHKQKEKLQEYRKKIIELGSTISDSDSDQSK